MGIPFNITLKFEDKEQSYRQADSVFAYGFYEQKQPTRRSAEFMVQLDSNLWGSYGRYGEGTSVTYRREYDCHIVQTFDEVRPAGVEIALPPEPPTNTQEYIEQRRTRTQRVSDFIADRLPESITRGRR